MALKSQVERPAWDIVFHTRAPVLRFIQYNVKKCQEAPLSEGAFLFYAEFFLKWRLYRENVRKCQICPLSVGHIN